MADPLMSENFALLGVVTALGMGVAGWSSPCSRPCAFISRGSAGASGAPASRSILVTQPLRDPGMGEALVRAESAAVEFMPIARLTASPAWPRLTA